MICRVLHILIFLSVMLLNASEVSVYAINCKFTDGKRGQVRM